MGQKTKHGWVVQVSRTIPITGGEFLDAQLGYKHALINAKVYKTRKDAREVAWKHCEVVRKVRTLNGKAMAIVEGR